MRCTGSDNDDCRAYILQAHFFGTIELTLSKIDLFVRFTVYLNNKDE